ncbi:MarR family winged helix-turn-helix transcriptional regulator [Chitinophagaceae bacterium MMS25-I14]
MKKNTSDFQLASDLRTIVGRLMKKMRNKSSVQGILSLTERSVIGLLSQYNELTPGELASMEKITTQSMSQILSHLSELGFINRIASETDKRKAIISLSESGHAILNKVRNERDEWLYQALQETCSEKERETLGKAAVLLARLVDFE